MSAGKRQYDLTQGGIIGKLLVVAVPLMGTQLLQLTYNLADMFWLGRVSSDVVAASGTAGMYLWLSNGLIFIGRLGAEIGVSHSLGRGEPEDARGYSQNALFLSAVLGALFALIMGVFHRPLIGFFDMREAHVVQAAEQYLIITALGILPSFLSATIAGTFTAAGDSRLPFFINMVGVALNMALDPLLIFTFDLSIAGAAIATTTSQIVVALLSLIALRWGRTCPLGSYSFRLCIQPEKIKQIFRWSLAAAIQNMLFVGLGMVISRLIAVFGAGAVAVQKVGTQVESMSWLIAGGFSSAITAFIGQNYGAGNWERIRRCVRFSVISMSVWGLIISLLLYFAGGMFVSLFLSEPELIEMGATYLRILALSQVITTLEMVAGGGFRGIGKTLPPSIASAVTNSSRVVLCYLLANTAMGVDGIWWGITIGGGVRGLWILIWFIIMVRRQPHGDLQHRPT